MVWPEDVYSSHAMETSTIIQEEDEGVSERVLRIRIEFADILLRVAKFVDR